MAERRGDAGPNDRQANGPGGEAMAELDARGLRCPEPVMLLHKAMAELSPGARLRVLATDPTTERDIPQFCRFLGHELLFCGRRGDSGERGERGDHTESGEGGDRGESGENGDDLVYVLRKGA